MTHPIHTPGAPPAGRFGPGHHLDTIDDPVHDPYQVGLKLSSPTVCSECGALYADGHWQWASTSGATATIVCPACLRTRDRRPAGDITVDAALAGPNHTAITALAHKLEAHENRDHPLWRVMAIAPAEGADGTLRITTTDPQLARLLGHALALALHAEASYAFVPGEHLLRVQVGERESNIPKDIT